MRTTPWTGKRELLLAPAPVRAACRLPVSAESRPLQVLPVVLSLVRDDAPLAPALGYWAPPAALDWLLLPLEPPDVLEGLEGPHDDDIVAVTMGLLPLSPLLLHPPLRAVELPPMPWWLLRYAKRLASLSYKNSNGVPLASGLCHCSVSSSHSEPSLSSQCSESCPCIAIDARNTAETHRATKELHTTIQAYWNVNGIQPRIGESQ